MTYLYLLLQKKFELTGEVGSCRCFFGRMRSLLDLVAREALSCPSSWNDLSDMSTLASSSCDKVSKDPSLLTRGDLEGWLTIFVGDWVLLFGKLKFDEPTANPEENEDVEGVLLSERERIAATLVS